jgi:hypothetical protein
MGTVLSSTYVHKKSKIAKKNEINMIGEYEYQNNIIIKSKQLCLELRPPTIISIDSSIPIYREHTFQGQQQHHNISQYESNIWANGSDCTYHSLKEFILGRFHEPAINPRIEPLMCLPSEF